jgi:hypothetical protein
VVVVDVVEETFAGTTINWLRSVWFSSGVCSFFLSGPGTLATQRQPGCRNSTSSTAYSHSFAPNPISTKPVAVNRINRPTQHVPLTLHTIGRDSDTVIFELPQLIVAEPLSLTTPSGILGVFSGVCRQSPKARFAL